jgi:hypothetical protein
MAGTFPTCRELRAASSCDESKTSPLMASFIFLRPLEIVLISPLNLSSSYVSTVFILWLYSTGNFFSASSTSNGAGSFSRIELARLMMS